MSESNIQPVADIGKIMKVTRCIGFGALQSSPQGYSYYLKNENRYSFKEPTKTALAQYALKRLQEAKIKDEEIHKQNLVSLENNKAIRIRVLCLMKEIGIPDTFQEKDEKSRSRTTKWITRTAGYMGDLERSIPIHDGYSPDSYARLEADYKRFEAEGIAEDEKIKREAENEVKRKSEERKANIQLAAVILRHNLPEDSEWQEVYEALCKKNSRLDLAMAMQSVRNNWNDGPGPVEYALGRFKIQNKEDEVIYDSVNATLGTWEDNMDGRIFRDCEWDYSRILASIEDKQLVQDADLALSKQEGY
jgi:hypothetical protein